MIKKGIIPVLSLGHGINDLLAGYFLGTIALQSTNLLQAGIALFIYNLLAFGGQYPLALWIERYNNKKQFLVASFSLNVCAALVFAYLSSFAVVLAGFASAAYHVAGGTVCSRNSKASQIGLFAAPGVAGLIAGGYFSWMGIEIMPVLQAGSFLFLVLLLLLKIPSTGNLNVSGVENNYHSLKPDRHDLIMILLLTVIALRSAVWNIFQLLHDGDYGWLGVIAAAAFTGKLAGGWIADKIGWRLYVYISLFTAAPLVTFFKNELVLFCIGIGLLQSGIPATTALLIKAAKGRTERGVGLSFGTAVIAGGIIFTIPVTALQNQILIPCFILSFTLALFWLATREKNVL